MTMYSFGGRREKKHLNLFVSGGLYSEMGMKLQPLYVGTVLHVSFFDAPETKFLHVSSY